MKTTASIFQKPFSVFLFTILSPLWGGVFAQTAPPVGSNCHITYVGLGDLANTSGKTASYTNYSPLGTVMSGCGQYPLSVRVNTGGDFTVHVRAWFDWNGDGSFNGPGEQMDLGTATASSRLTAPRSTTSSFWEKPVSAEIDSFYVYREITQNNYQRIGAVPYEDDGRYHDFDANPNETSYRYRIAALDTCGVESSLSPFHNSIHLQSLGNGNLQLEPLCDSGAAEPR
jgi:hypothetical protein